MKSPAYQQYPKDFLSSIRVAELSLAEEGAYRRLLDLCWIAGSIPNDAKRIARIIGKGCTEETARICMEFFIPSEDDPARLVNERQEQEREVQARHRDQRRQAANARWDKRGTSTEVRGKQAKSHSASAAQSDNVCDRNATALHMECSSSSSSSSIQKKELPSGSSKERPPQQPISNPSDADVKEAVYVGELVTKIAAELGVKKLTHQQTRKWSEVAKWSFENGYHQDQVIGCYSELRQKHNYPILPDYLYDRVPEFVKHHKPQPRLPTVAERKAEDRENSRILFTPDGGTVEMTH